MGDWLIDFFNAFIALVGTVLNVLFSLLPPSPFTLLSNMPFVKYLGWLNYLLPISECIAILEAWLVCVGVYYLYQVVLRWIKVVE